LAAATTPRPSADDYGFANQRRIIPLLNRGIKGIHVDVQDHKKIQSAGEGHFESCRRILNL